MADHGRGPEATTLTQKYKSAMHKISHPLGVADARALLHIYNTPAALNRFESEEEREEYMRALEYFRTYSSVVPYISEDIRELEKRTAGLESELGRQGQTLRVRHNALLVLATVRVVSVLACAWLAWSTLRRADTAAVAFAETLGEAVKQLQARDGCPNSSNWSTVACRVAEADVDRLVEALWAAQNVSAPQRQAAEAGGEADDGYTPRYALLLGAATPHTGPCVPLAHDSEEIDVGELRNSVRYHLTVGQAAASDKRLSYLTAAHVGSPYCYAVINTNYSHKLRYRNDEALVEMFNPTIVGVSTESLVRSRERHHECERSAIYIRYETIWVRYEDASGRVIERRFDGPLSYEVQHIAELHAGRFRCYDDLKDAVAAAIDLSIARNAAPHPHHHHHPQHDQIRWELPAAQGPPELSDSSTRDDPRATIVE